MFRYSVQWPPHQRGFTITHTHNPRQNFSGRVITAKQRPLPGKTQHSQHTSMPPAGFELSIATSERPQTHPQTMGLLVQAKWYSQYTSYEKEHNLTYLELQHQLTTSIKLTGEWQLRWTDSVVGGIVTRYGLDVLGIESQWKRDLPHPSRPASCTITTVSFQGFKRPGCGVNQPSIQRRLELYF